MTGHDQTRRWTVRTKPDAGTARRAPRGDSTRVGLAAVAALLALLVLAKLAYVGALRLVARADGLPIGGHGAVDATAVAAGVAGSLAVVAAVAAGVRRRRARPR